MQYVQTGGRRLEIPNAIVAQGGDAVNTYAASPPDDAVYVDVLPVPAIPAPPTSDAPASTDDED